MENNTSTSGRRLLRPRDVMARGFFQNWTTDDDGNLVRVGLTKDETFEYQVH